MEHNNPLQKKMDKENDNRIILEMLTHFLYSLQEKLQISMTDSEKYNFISIDKMGIYQLKKKLNAIEEKIDLLVSLEQKNQVNDLLMKIKEDNAVLEREIDELRKGK